MRFLPKRTRAGFSLVEVTMAIGLMSFCLVAMLGILPVGLSQERKSTDQLLALQALGAVTADFQNASLAGTNSKSPQYGISISSSGSSSLWLDQALAKTTDIEAKQFDVTYKIEQPKSRFSNYRMWVKVSRSTRSASSSDADRSDYVESVVLKSAM